MQNAMNGVEGDLLLCISREKNIDQDNLHHRLQELGYCEDPRHRLDSQAIGISCTHLVNTMMMQIRDCKFTQERPSNTQQHKNMPQCTPTENVLGYRMILAAIDRSSHRTKKCKSKQQTKSCKQNAQGQLTSLSKSKTRTRVIMSDMGRMHPNRQG